MITVDCLLKESTTWLVRPDNSDATNPVVTTSRSGGSPLTAELSLSQRLTCSSLVLLHIFCGVIGSVSNELLLKKEPAPVVTQNVLMYGYSVLCNAGLLLVQGQLLEAFSLASLSAAMQPVVMAIVVILVTIGIVTSFFLKHLGSVHKSIASALEVP